MDNDRDKQLIDSYVESMRGGVDEFNAAATKAIIDAGKMFDKRFEEENTFEEDDE